MSRVMQLVSFWLTSLRPSPLADERRGRHPTRHTCPSQDVRTSYPRRRTRAACWRLFSGLHNAQSSAIDRPAVCHGYFGEHACVRADRRR